MKQKRNGIPVVCHGVSNSEFSNALQLRSADHDRPGMRMPDMLSHKTRCVHCGHLLSSGRTVANLYGTSCIGFSPFVTQTMRVPMSESPKKQYLVRQKLANETLMNRREPKLPAVARARSLHGPRFGVWPGGTVCFTGDFQVGLTPEHPMSPSDKCL